MNEELNNFYVKGFSDCILETRGQKCLERNILIEDENKKQKTIIEKYKGTTDKIGQKIVDGNKIKMPKAQVESVNKIDFFFSFYLPKEDMDANLKINKNDFISVTPDIFKKGISLDRNGLDLLILKNSELKNAVENVDIEKTNKLLNEINNIR